MPRGVHDRAVRDVGEDLPRRLDAGDVGGIVQGREVGKLAEGGQGMVIDDDGLGELVPSVHHPVAHRLDVGEVRDLPDLGVHEGLDDQLDGHLVVGAVMLPLDLLPDPSRVVVDEGSAHGDALDDPLGKDLPFLPAVELVLQRRAPAVESQYIHEAFPFARGTPRRTAARPHSRQSGMALIGRTGPPR